MHLHSFNSSEVCLRGHKKTVLSGLLAGADGLQSQQQSLWNRAAVLHTGLQRNADSDGDGVECTLTSF